MICKPTKVVILKNKPPLLTGPLFTKLEISDKRIIIVQGGGDAAKTSTILQWLAVKCIQTNNIQATVVGMSGPNLKRGAIRLFKKYVAIDPQISPFLKTWNKTDKEQYFANGSILSFVSFEDDEEKARGAENDYVFMNEANLSSYNLFWQLQRKCRKKVILDYNPTFAFWAHAKLKNGGEKQFVDKVQMYIVDHRHNPFLTEEEHQAYEDISDPEMFKVYARGETGQTKGAIFKFKKVDKIPTKQVVDEKGNISEVELDFGFGIDIGYTTDKTAIIKAWTNAKDHYYKELLYKSNDEIQNEINENSLLDEAGKPQTIEGYIKKILVENGMTSSTMVWGDHDKNMSSKLRRVGVPYRMAKKGPNSVTASISSVKRFNGHYIDSPNLEEELKTYIFETVIDILTGNEVTTGEPVEGMPDHLIAAIRMFEHSYAMRFAG
jgi:hypothetical protein